MSVCIATYGTLVEGGKFSKQFDKDRIMVQPVRMAPFIMYDCGGMYPAVVYGEDWDHDYITAELHLYRNAQDVIRRMKVVEGNLFDFKKLKNVKERMKGKDYSVWMFMWNLKTDGKRRIDNGDWRAFTAHHNQNYKGRRK